jgi:hypothetical protein
MNPVDLKPEQFNGYPPEARKIVVEHLAALRQLPLSFLPSLLREAIDYDYRFPAERRAMERELGNLSSLSQVQLKDWCHGFEQIRVSSQLQDSDWVNTPANFVDQLSAYLWSTHQLDAFRAAAMEYAARLHAAVPPEKPAMPRLGISVIGQGVSAYDEPLFRKLRPQGAYYTSVNPENGLKMLLDAVAARAKAHPVPYGHWYIDGGQEAAHDPALTCVSYQGLESVRTAIYAKFRAEVGKPGMGPEALRTTLARLKPADLGMGSTGTDKTSDPVMDRFQVRVLTEGAGTQVFSTTFAQWTAREALRRAQPLTMIVRFAARQRQKPMNEMLYGTEDAPQLDFVGSLVDADMGAYYNWLNQQRLPGAEQSSFLVWFEGHDKAVAVGPAVPRGTESNSTADLHQLLAWAS